MGVYIWTNIGIYHNSTLGLISLSSNGSNLITIADKNLGRNGSSVNAFQFGNNYGFNSDSTVTVSTTAVDISSSQVPSNYSSNTFINTTPPYTGSYFNNLWGETTNTNIARKGPCNSGYHVPSKVELKTLMSIMSSFGITNTSSILFPLGTTLSNRVFTGSSRGNSTAIWLSSTWCYQYRLSDNTMHNFTSGRGYQIRPFKNDVVAPDASRTKLN